MRPLEPQRVVGYSQGGTIVGGIAYFTANSYRELLRDDGSVSNIPKAEGHPYVVAFDTETLTIVRTYPFADTYDSTPLVIDNMAGIRLVLAHEHKNARTVAMRADSAAIEWIGDANQPGSMFFGYSYYVRNDGSKLILASVQNGLHAMSLETGEDVWFVETRGGVTPCVDQRRGVVYMQTNGKLLQIDAETGAVMRSTTVEAPSSAVCWNTILADDERGCHIATYWYSPVPFGSAIRVYDSALNKVWEKKGLPMSKKSTNAYYGGVLYAGCGDHWQKRDYLNMADDSWKKITAYRIATGETKWELDLREYSFSCIPNVVYCNGMLLAETQTNVCGLGYSIFVIDASDGRLIDCLIRKAPANSCGVPLLSGGKWFSGDLISDSVLVASVGSGRTTDWIGAFGNAQTNDMCAPEGALEMTEG